MFADRPARSIFAFVIVGILAAGTLATIPAHAQADYVIVTNVAGPGEPLDPTTLDPSISYAVAGPDAYSSWAVSFVVPHHFHASPLGLVAGVQFVSGVNRLDYLLLPDDAGHPGAVPLASATIDYTPGPLVPGQTCLTYAYPAEPPALVADARYWLVLAAEGGAFKWLANGTGSTTPFASRTAPDGTWTVAAGPTPGFGVLVLAPVPEPGSLGLLVVGTALAIRWRKTKGH